MKTISILLLFAILAITLEKVTAEFMLVEIEDEEEKESQNRTCGFEGGDCCRNELPPGETLPEGVMNCDPGLTCASIKPMPNSPRKCLPTRNYGPTAAEPRVEGKSVAPLKQTPPVVKLPEPTSKPEQEQCMKEGDFHCNLPGQQDPGRNCCKGLRCQDHSPTFFPNTCVKDPFGKVDPIKDINRQANFPLTFKPTDPIEIMPDIFTRKPPKPMNTPLNPSAKLLKEKKLVELAKKGVCDKSCCCDDCFPCAEERIAKIIEGLEKVVMPANLTANDSAIDNYPDYDYPNTTVYDYPDTTEWSNTEDVENDTSVKIASKAPRSDEPLPLPDGWERMETIDGKVVYVDHENNKVHWDRPTQEQGQCMKEGEFRCAIAENDPQRRCCNGLRCMFFGGGVGFVSYKCVKDNSEPETEEKLLSRSGIAVRW